MPPATPARIRRRRTAAGGRAKYDVPQCGHCSLRVRSSRPQRGQLRSGASPARASAARTSSRTESLILQTSVDVDGGLRHYCAMDRFDPGRQPAGRQPAPGRLGYVQAFLNSFWDLDADGADHWETPAGLATWLRERGFEETVSEREHEYTVALREGLRDALRGEGWDGV